MIVGHKVKQEAKEEVGEGESMWEDFSSVTDKELQEMKEEMLQDAATIVGQEVKEEVEEVATNTDAVEPAIPPTAKRRRQARWETQRKLAAQTLIEAFVKMDEAAPVPNQIPFPQFGKGVKALQDSVPQAPEAPATSAKPVRFRRHNSGKQSGVPNVTWNKGCWVWAVNFPLFDKKGKKQGARTFSLSKFMKKGLTEAEADTAALEAAKAFRAELVKQGILKEPKPVDPNFTSEVPGVRWHKPGKKMACAARPQERQEGAKEENSWRLLHRQGCRRVQGLGAREAPWLGAQGDGRGSLLGAADLRGEGALPRGDLGAEESEVACPVPNQRKKSAFSCEAEGPQRGRARSVSQEGRGLEEEAEEGAGEGGEANEFKEIVKKSVSATGFPHPTSRFWCTSHSFRVFLRAWVFLNQPWKSKTILKKLHLVL